MIISIGAEIHLLLLNDIHKSTDEFDCSDSDDDVEVTSNVEAEENDLTDMSTYLSIDSSELYTDNEDPSKSPLATGSACSWSDSENDDTLVDSTCPSVHCMTVSSAHSSSSTITTSHAMMMIEKMKRILLKKSLVRQHSNSRRCYLLRNRSSR